MKHLYQLASVVCLIGALVCFAAIVSGDGAAIGIGIVMAGATLGGLARWKERE